MTDVWERVARAICVAQGFNCDERDDYGKYRWETFTDEARAAVRALREAGWAPTRPARPRPPPDPPARSG